MKRLSEAQVHAEIEAQLRADNERLRAEGCAPGQCKYGREILAAKDAEIERLRRENDALYDMILGMKINLTKILEGRRALEPKP